MVERFLSQTSFVSQEDYRKNLHIRVPENFNFGYDVVDAYAAEQPGKEALLWTDDQGAEIRFTFADIKRESDRTASYFQSLGIPVEIIKKIHEKGENCEKYLKSGKVDMVLNTISYGSQIEQEGYDLRRIAVELAIPCITSLDTAKEVLRVMASTGGAEHHVEAIQDYVKE